MERLFKSRKTVLELLEDRGYSEASSKHMTWEEFNKWCETLNLTSGTVKEGMEMVLGDSEGDPKGSTTRSLRDSQNKRSPIKILVHWHIPRKLGSQESTNLVSRMREKGITRAIVIIEDSLTHCAKNTLKDLKQEKTYIDVFTMEEMQFNLSHHQLVPLHQVCSREEKKKLMSAYAVDRNQLPHIRSIDPMVRYLGALKGDLIRITRDSDTMPGEKTISYRLVV